MLKKPLLNRFSVRQSKHINANPRDIWQFAAELQYKSITRQEGTKEYGKWLTQKLISLGPAFVKLGQFLSTRNDILGSDVTAELSNLQDQVNSVPLMEIQKVIEAELGIPFQDIFSEFSKEPLASASIGQVHLATLRKDQWQVIVKVQKPDVDNSIRSDLNTIRSILNFMTTFNHQRRYETVELLSQYETFLSAELDYLQEAHHMQKMEEIFDDIPDVKIPRVYKNISKRRVLFMEYVPSTKVSQLTPQTHLNVDLPYLATRLVQTFLYSAMTYGMIHCDPHPGNIGITKEGTIVLYDFGNVVTLQPEFLKSLNKLLLSIYQKDVDEFLHLVIDLKILILSPDTDMNSLRAFFSSFFDYLENQDLGQLKTSLVTAELRDDLSVKIDPNIMYLFRIFALLDGTCGRLDPEFNYVKALTPVVSQFMNDPEFIQAKIQKDIRQLTAYPKMVQSTDRRIESMSRKMKAMSQENRVFFSLAIVLSITNIIENPLAAIFLGPLALLAVSTMK